MQMHRGLESFIFSVVGGPLLAKSSTFILHMKELGEYNNMLNTHKGNQSAPAVIRQIHWVQSAGNLDIEVAPYSFILNFPSDPVVHLLQIAGLATVYFGDRAHSQTNSVKEKVIRNLTMLLTSSSALLAPEIVKQFLHRVSTDSPVWMTGPEIAILGMALVGLAYYSNNIRNSVKEKKRNNLRIALGRKI